MCKQLIITHPGSAHFDEMTAISLILACNQDTVFSIERREPTQEEIMDKKVWVVDTGGSYDPARLNFDHHQDLDCPASFILVAQYLGLSDMLSTLSWWRFKDHVDRFGPVRSSKMFNAGDEMVNINPVENWFKDFFSRDPQGLAPQLRSYGLYIIDIARRLKDQIDFWKTCERVSIAGVSAMVGNTEDTTGLEEFRRMEDNPPEIVLSLTREGQGWRLFRYEGAPVDFTRISNSPDIAFAHKSGFLAKTVKRLDLKDLIPLVSKAVIRP